MVLTIHAPLGFVFVLLVLFALLRLIIVLFIVFLIVPFVLFIVLLCVFPSASFDVLDVIFPHTLPFRLRGAALPLHAPLQAILSIMLFLIVLFDMLSSHRRMGARGAAQGGAGSRWGSAHLFARARRVHLPP